MPHAGTHHSNTPHALIAVRAERAVCYVLCAVRCVRCAVCCARVLVVPRAVGSNNRAVAATQMNERSSRGHSVLMLVVSQRLRDGTLKVSVMLTPWPLDALMP